MEKFAQQITQKLIQGLFFVCFLGSVVAGAMMAYPKYELQRGLIEQRARINRRIEDKMHEIAEYKAKQRRFNTDREFVEDLARQSRRVYPGELVFVFDD